MLIAQRWFPSIAVVAIMTGAATAMAVGVAVGRNPELVATVLVATGVLCFLLPRLRLVTALLAACFFFDDYLTTTFDFGFWNPGKLIGVLAVGSFVYRWLVERAPVPWARQVPVLIGLGASVALSHTFARDVVVSEQVAIRYLMFFVLFFITLQAIRGRSDAHTIIDVTVIAATAAAVIGLGNFFLHGWTRVAGPILDPGDFGFVLASTVPLAVYRVATAAGTARVLHVVAVVLLVAAVIGTFARADVLGLVAAGTWVLASGRARIRWAAIGLVVVALIGLTAYQARPDLIEKSLQRKQHVAQRNVDSRLGLWGVAIDEWQTAPLVGVGPGNYQIRFPEFVSPFELRVQTTHNAYLNVLAELGLIGLVLFIAYLALTWDQLRRRTPDDKHEDWLRTAVAAGFVVAFVGAFFMTQQFYPPIWFLGAIGAALDDVRRREASEPAVVIRG